MSEEIAEGIPGAELVVLETCGHIPMLEWPEETTDLLRQWLDRIKVQRPSVSESIFSKIVSDSPANALRSEFPDGLNMLLGVL